MTLVPDPDLDAVIAALVEHRFTAVGSICARTGVRATDDEIRPYAAALVADGIWSAEQHDLVLTRVAEYRRWGRRNAVIVLPLLVAVFIGIVVSSANNGQWYTLIGPLLMRRHGPAAERPAPPAARSTAAAARPSATRELGALRRSGAASGHRRASSYGDPLALPNSRMTRGDPAAPLKRTFTVASRSLPDTIASIATVMAQL